MFKRLFPDLKPLTKYIAQGPKNKYNKFPKTLYQMQILLIGFHGYFMGIYRKLNRERFDERFGSVAITE